MSSPVGDSVPWSTLALGLLLIGVFFAFRWRRSSESHPPSTYILPNGKTIHHLRKAETDLLYGEILANNAQCYCLPDSDPDAEDMALKLQPGAVVVDVGANIGMFALWAAWHPSIGSGGSVRVLSFEPVPSTFAVLEKNAAMYSTVKCRLEAHACGLSSRNSTATIHHHPNFSIWSTADASMDGARDAMLRENLPHIAKRVSGRDDLPRLVRFLPESIVQAFVRLAGGRALNSLNATEAVECSFRRLSDVVFREGGVERVSLLKVDVEGAELEVLRGIDANDWTRIDQIAMECENLQLVREVTELLEGNGFRVKSWVSGDMAALLPTSQVRQLIGKRRC
jgi:FkbM family methyltransferase